MYEEKIRDFAERTRANLRAIEQRKAEGHEAYEVTQLVNSMLGLLVFPQQRYVDKIPHTSLEELEQQGWPIPSVREGFQQVENLNQLVRHLRNAIAHFNVDFIGDGKNEVKFLHVWNTNPRGLRTWEAELSVSDLQGIAERFIELLLESPHIT